MSRFQRVFATTIFASLVWTETEVLFASQGGDHSSIGSLIPYWVNFSIYVGLLFFLLRKTVASGWMARRNAILERVTAAAQELESAERALRASEDRTKNIEHDKETAKQEIIQQAHAEAQQIVESAKQRAERQKVQAQELISGESRSAQSQVRAELVAQAVELARGRFQAGVFAGKEGSYREAALGRAKRLVQ